MTISLLNIFDSRGLGFVLLEALIDHEVEETGMFNPASSIVVKTNSTKKMKRSFSEEIASRPKCYRFTRSGKEQHISKRPCKKF